MSIKRWTFNAQERASLAAFSPPFIVAQPERLRTPLVFASPHSGSVYPDSFLAQSAQPLTALRRNEDMGVDALFEGVTDHGAPLLSAQFPRCFVDANRAADELPSGWTSAAEPPTVRARAGFGVIPTILSEKAAIYSDHLPETVAKARLSQLYHPYHDALRGLIATAQTQFGRALVVDCHSMPGFAPMGARRADVVLGDRFGVSCDSAVMDIVERAFKDHALSVTRNYPYAGGHVTAHYGAARSPVQAIQIELNRDLYMNEAVLRLKPAPFAALQETLRSVTAQIIRDVPDTGAHDYSYSQAAE